MITENIHEIGDLIDRRFEVLKVMHGGMGQIFVCRDHSNKTNDFVVLKTFSMHPESKDYQAYRDRFLREAEAWYRIGRAGWNLDSYYVGLSGTAIINGRPYLLMDYFNGGNLRERIANGPLKPEPAIYIATQILLGLQIICDEHGIVHRDIKPENILFCENGHAAVSDLGIANFIGASDSTQKITGDTGSLTKYGSFIGTVPYAAPEQLAGHSPLDQGVDIWAFGVLLYEMLTGNLPFTGESVEDLAHSIMEDAVPQVDQITKRYGKPVGLVVRKCLKKHRSSRYTNFQAIIRDWDKVIRFKNSPRKGLFGRDTRFLIEDERIEIEFEKFFPGRQSKATSRVDVSAMNRSLQAADLRRIGKPEMALDSCSIALNTIVNGRTNLDRLLAQELDQRIHLLQWRERCSDEMTAWYSVPPEDVIEEALYIAMCCYVDMIESITNNSPKPSERNRLIDEFLALCDKFSSSNYQNDQLTLMHAEGLLLDNKFDSAYRILSHLYEKDPANNQVANVYWITGTKFLTDDFLKELAVDLLQAHAKMEIPGSKMLCARIFNHFNNFPRVEEMSREALSLDPGNLYAMYLLTGALLNQSKKGEASKVFWKMRQLDPNHNLTRGASAWFLDL